MSDSGLSEIQEIYESVDSAQDDLQNLLKRLDDIFDAENKTLKTTDKAAIETALDNIEVYAGCALHKPNDHIGIPDLGIEPALKTLLKLGANPEERQIDALFAKQPE